MEVDKEEEEEEDEEEEEEEEEELEPSSTPTVKPVSNRDVSGQSATGLAYYDMLTCCSGIQITPGFFLACPLPNRRTVEAKTVRLLSSR